jgi:hypothetical protein
MAKQLPTFDELPIDSKYPEKTAWGLWGEEDNLGTLNLLTEERVANVRVACREDKPFEDIYIFNIGKQEYP